MLNSDELFLFFAQVGKYAVNTGDGSGRPEFNVPNHKKAYDDFVLSVQGSEEFEAVSNEVFQILLQLITFDYLHDRVESYILAEKNLRKMNKPHFNYDVEKVEADLKELRPLFEAQYSSDLKSKLKLSPENVPDNLLTGTGNRIVKLKDYLFHQGPISQIAAAVMLNHQGREVLWPD